MIAKEKTKLILKIENINNIYFEVDLSAVTYITLDKTKMTFYNGALIEEHGLTSYSHVTAFELSEKQINSLKEYLGDKLTIINRKEIIFNKI